MEANELRIGNYVKAIHPRHGEKFIKIESITVEKINIDFRSYSFNEVNPIELTEEWLLRFGFKKRGVEWCNDCEDCDGICLEQNINEVFYSAGEGVKLSIGIKYIHQLQNLYFALTGEELTLNN